MKILCYGSTPCCQVVQTKWRLVEKNFNSRQSRFSSFVNHGISCSNWLKRTSIHANQ
ncbi:hypothetical protein HN51_018462, partial [Arachis hypogaea]